MAEHHTHALKVIWTLNRISGFGPQRFKELCEAVSPIEQLVTPEVSARLSADSAWGPRFVSDFEQAFGLPDFEQERDACEKLGINMIHCFDPAYPTRLREIFDPPLVLYVRGSFVPEDEIAIAIVGTRRPSVYGLRTARRFASELAARGVTVVSGMARGIDGEAHRGAISVRGRTIAVLGSGLDVIFPKEHAGLFEQIAANGAVVSEFPLGTLPLPFHFPKRNRIISGLTMGVLAVEANERSGSLITTSCALDEGREVYAIPGPVDSVTSRGTNQLIQRGAKLASSADDILCDLSPQIRAALPPAQTSGEGQTEDPILKLLCGERPVHFDELVASSGFDAHDLSDRLIRLELAGQVKRTLGGEYVKVPGT